jgi:hypothetical protein
MSDFNRIEEARERVIEGSDMYEEWRISRESNPDEYAYLQEERKRERDSEPPDEEGEE